VEQGKFGHFTRDLERSRAELEELQATNDDRTMIQAKIDMIDELLRREEMVWL
jgi:hypothetical protein